MAEPFLVTAAQVLAMLLDAEPRAAASPHVALYPATAAAIADVANARPLFAGADGPLKTASVDASLQWFESNGNVAAEGDCRFLNASSQCDRSRADRGDPQSFGLYQVGQSNFAFLAVTREAMTTDPVVQTQAANKLITVSFHVCRGRPEEDLLGQYASGGSTCGGLEKSRHRMLKAKWLFARAKERAAKITSEANGAK